MNLIKIKCSYAAAVYARRTKTDPAKGLADISLSGQRVPVCRLAVRNKNPPISYTVGIHGVFLTKKKR